MNDAKLNAMRQHLKTCHKLLKVRLAELEQQPKGRVLRENRISHTRAMLGLLGVLRGLAAHDPLDWWEDNEDVPF